MKTAQDVIEARLALTAQLPSFATAGTHALTVRISGDGKVTSALLVVRHAKAHKRGLWEGPDPKRPLNEVGEAQAHALSSILRSFGVSRVLSSSSTRCLQTVQPSLYEAATLDGDEYVINGQKIFVGSDNGADRIWMIAVTNPGGKRHENLSWFMIDANLPGITNLGGILRPIQPHRAARALRRRASRGSRPALRFPGGDALRGAA